MEWELKDKHLVILSWLKLYVRLLYFNLLKLKEKI